MKGEALLGDGEKSVHAAGKWRETPYYHVHVGIVVMFFAGVISTSHKDVLETALEFVQELAPWLLLEQAAFMGAAMMLLWHIVACCKVKSTGKLIDMYRLKRWCACKLLGTNLVLLNINYGPWQGFFKRYLHGPLFSSLLIIYIDTILAPWFWQWCIHICKTGSLRGPFIPEEDQHIAGDDDDTVYLHPDKSYAVWVFMLQMLLTGIFLLDVGEQTDDTLRACEETPSCPKFDVVYWIAGFLLQMFAATTADNMDRPFSMEVWKKIDTEKWERQRRANHSKLYWWDSKEWRFVMDYLVNRVAWGFILYLIPIIGGKSKCPDDFLQNALVFAFIVKLDNAVAHTDIPTIEHSNVAVPGNTD